MSVFCGDAFVFTVGLSPPASVGAGIRLRFRFYESPFTDITPQGPQQLFSADQIDELTQVLDKVRQNANVA